MVRDCERIEKHRAEAKNPHLIYYFIEPLIHTFPICINRYRKLIDDRRKKASQYELITNECKMDAVLEQD